MHPGPGESLDGRRRQRQRDHAGEDGRPQWMCPVCLRKQWSQQESWGFKLEFAQADRRGVPTLKRLRKHESQIRSTTCLYGFSFLP